ncbi:phosphatidate cytidylyltransferase [Thalassotalea insulae]|uniref:Phosphatidate cytidylyltransferase n=1 Tax=Thalassotalea insulae TaxID=2056778 RepID=A0ABQ6GRE8_9GAMM|nr:phosphatidate cytidylyltransferase [Thalassotalea insulae]GLX77192.1 phosphatidate cytidylyltransferase [Thalassotalea insulae]
MLLQRIITALLLAPLAIAAIFYMSLDSFSVFVMVIMAIGAWEWGPLMGFDNKRRRLAFVLATGGLIACLWYLVPLENLWASKEQLQDTVYYILWLAVIWWLISATLTFLYPRYSSFWSRHRSIRGVFGWLTLIPTWLAFMVLRTSDYNVDPYHGAQLIMFLFLMVWSADVGAYFVGKSIGKHKLLPNVSPGKTMEGFIGGVVFACLLVTIAGYLLQWQQYQYLLVLAVTMLITTISVLGDLNESMFKRQAGIKDSGSILPGHGGVLDRIDSLTATTPIFALCYACFGWH